MSLRPVLLETIEEFFTDACPRFAAAISYYAVFSIPALAILATLFLGLFLEPDDLERTVLEMVAVITSEQAAEGVRPVLRRVENPAGTNPVSWLLAGAGLLFGATGAFIQVQAALNRAWYVEPAGGPIVRTFLWKRAVSFLLLGLLGILLLLALGTSALVLGAGEAVAARLIYPLGEGVLFVLELTLSLAVLTLVFATVLRLFPDARVAWRDVLGGAFATAVLFWIGKSAIAYYLARAEPGRTFGVAGSLVLVLLWVYYCANLFLLGAEWTQVRARRSGRRIRPSRGATLTDRGRELAVDRRRSEREERAPDEAAAEA